MPDKLSANQQRPANVQCKVCTKPIGPNEQHMMVYYEGTYYVVCCASCAAKFESFPKQYLVQG